MGTPGGCGRWTGSGRYPGTAIPRKPKVSGHADMALGSARVLLVSAGTLAIVTLGRLKWAVAAPGRRGSRAGPLNGVALLATGHMQGAPARGLAWRHRPRPGPRPAPPTR